MLTLTGLLSACGGGGGDGVGMAIPGGNSTASAQPTCDIDRFADQLLASLNDARANARTERIATPAMLPCVPTCGRSVQPAGAVAASPISP